MSFALLENIMLFVQQISRSPEDPKRLLIKRILAKEGDTVKTLPPYPDPEVVIPKGHVWVEGQSFFHYLLVLLFSLLTQATNIFGVTTATASGLYVPFECHS